MAFAHRLMSYVRLSPKIMATVHLVIQDTSCQVTNVFRLKIFTFLSVELSVKMVNAHNVKTDITYQMMFAHLFLYFVILLINQLESVLHVHRVTSSKMINASIQLWALIPHALTIRIHIAHNVDKDTFYKIISVRKLIRNVLNLIIRIIYAKNVTTQLHKGPIAYE